MQYISRILVVVALVFVAHTANAQPPARKNDNKKSNKTETTAVVELTERAKSQYPVTQTPQEVDWKRELYRSLDLTNEKNAPLYYPVEQIGDHCNLFTFLFNNIIDGKITAYTYNLDGVELFTDDNIADIVNMLENFYIYYEETDGKLVIEKSDIPSAEVLSYYIKELHYYDQRTGTYGTKVTAICPVLHRSGDFGEEVTKYPMFWLKYDDISALLAQQPVMTSSLNNVMSMTLDDYFRRGSYSGEIYKTVNMRNLTIAQYCNDSTEIKQEQEKIEQQLEDFRTNLWNTKTVAEIKQDSINAANAAANNTIENKTEKPAKKEKVKRTATKSTTKEKNVKKERKSSNATGSKQGSVSVRRERR